MSSPNARDAALAREFAALRSAVAASPLGERALLAVRGADRLSFLQGMLTNDVAGLRPGDGAFALLLTEQGRLVADLRVLALDDEVWLDVPSEARASVRAALERLIVADDVELDELPSRALAIRGPGAAALLAKLAPARGAEIAALGEGAHLVLEVAGVGARAARVRDVGVDGFHLWAADAAGADALLRAARDAGAEPASAAAVDAQRVAAGEARATVDYDEHTLAPEVPSLGRGISFRKGCYLGQEVVERVAARGHVNWLLVRLTLAADSGVERGARVTRDGAEVGRVSSVAALPDGSATVALARLRRAAAEPGTALDVATATGAAQAMVEPTGSV